MRKRRGFIRIDILFALLVLAVQPGAGQSNYQFRIVQRINVHGDEYTAIVATADGRLLAIATERGELLVWSVADRRILQSYKQGSPIHSLSIVGGTHTVIAAGGSHTGRRQAGVIRKWNLDDGSFMDFKDTGSTSLTSLAVEASTGIAAAATANGSIGVWNIASGDLIGAKELKQLVAGLAISGRTLAISAFAASDPKTLQAGRLPTSSLLLLGVDQMSEAPRSIIPQNSGRSWGELSFAPGAPLLAAVYADRQGQSVSLFDLSMGRELTNAHARKAAWSVDQTLLLFDGYVPVESIQVSATGEIDRKKLIEGGTWHPSGAADSMSGVVVSPQGDSVWEVFQLNAALVQCDLPTKTCEVLKSNASLPFVMQVEERSDGLVATGGDDGFVRVWQQPDYDLVKEFKVSRGVPQGLALFPESGKIVFSSSSREAPSNIEVGDLKTGEVRSLMSIPAPYVRVMRGDGGFIYKGQAGLVLADPETGETKREFAVGAAVAVFDVAQNGKWLAVVDERGRFYRFDVTTAARPAVSQDQIEQPTAIAIANDGRMVYATEWSGALRRWETRNKSISSIGSVRGQPRSLSVSSDGKRLAIGGNHRDVSVYESKGGDPIGYFQTSASDFYVTTTWISGNQLIFTTDSGVLFSGVLER